MAIWLHPSVTSTIVDNSGFYATADGVTTLFAPGFFEKGKDNELIAVDGPSDADLVKKFGKIDAIEYGQNHLNLVNWLTAGGSAIVMRCLPDNAQYAHAILEVLTKEVSVKVNKFTPENSEKPFEIKRDYDVDDKFIGLFYINDDGEKITLCDADDADDFLNTKSSVYTENKVSIIPKVTYVPSGVTKKETIEAYIRNKNYDQESNNLTGKGYARHILGYFIPEGRGAAFYNDIRISIKLTTNYDNTYDFRVYSVYFEKYDRENDEWGIIYGPYYVSFDETSRDFSDESMFIADVLNKYCEEFKFIPFGDSSDEDSGDYNAGFYGAAKAIAGSNASLRRVDVLSGKEYYDENTESFSTIHNNCMVNGGVYTLRKNVVESENDIIYVNEKNLPIPLSNIKINGITYKVSEVNTSKGTIRINTGITKGAYETEELNKIIDDNERAEKAAIKLLKDNTIIYSEDIEDQENKAYVKESDSAIVPISSTKEYKSHFNSSTSQKFFKFYLSKNGADFVKDMDVSVTLDSILKKGDNLETYPSVLDITGEFTTKLLTFGRTAGVFLTANSTTTDDVTTYSDTEIAEGINRYKAFGQPIGKLKIWKSSLISSSPEGNSIEAIGETQNIRFSYDATENKITLTEIPEHIATSDGLAVNDIFTYNSQLSSQAANIDFYKRDDNAFILVIKAIRNENGVPVNKFIVHIYKTDCYVSDENMTSYVGNQSFTLKNGNKTINAEYTSLVEETHYISDEEVLSGKIVDIDDIDDSITVGFTINSENRNTLENLDKYDTSEYGVLSPLSDGYSAYSIVIEQIGSPFNKYSKYLSLSEDDYVYMSFGSAGTSDTFGGASRTDVAKTRKSLLVKAFNGSLNPAITMKKFWPFDIILDANYDNAVKSAINDLTTLREDFMFLCDTGFCATPEQAIDKRNNFITFNNRYTAIFTQDMRVYDEYTGKNIKVTPTYFLAKKIPYVDRAYGIHYAFVGPNRGEIEGMIGGTLSWNPTEAQKEKLYKKQLNYIQHDPNHLMFMGQLTSQKRSTSLSDIPNVRALLMIRRNIENICEEYYFERINDNLLSIMNNACNNYIGQWVLNGTLSEGNVSVYASEYDMKQKLVRVQVEMKFTSFLERVVITFTVK